VSAALGAKEFDPASGSCGRRLGPTTLAALPDLAGKIILSVPSFARKVNAYLPIAFRQRLKAWKVRGKRVFIMFFDDVSFLLPGA
jgi:hypothetical protein